MFKSWLILFGVGILLGTPSVFANKLEQNLNWVSLETNIFIPAIIQNIEDIDLLQKNSECESATNEEKLKCLATERQKNLMSLCFAIGLVGRTLAFDLAVSDGVGEWFRSTEVKKSTALQLVYSLREDGNDIPGFCGQENSTDHELPYGDFDKLKERLTIIRGKMNQLMELLKP
jgi:hypothetical protein